MKDIYIRHISSRLGLKDWQVENCIQMLEDGGTIPFICRYRKERTGGMDDAEVATVKHLADVFSDMEKRKDTILQTIVSLGKLTPELEKSIEECINPTELEDIYLPYRPKRRTRATIAREAGLEPLADRMMAVRGMDDPAMAARKFLNDKVVCVDDALAGARDIIAERLSESMQIRDKLRRYYRAGRLCAKATKAAQGNADAAKYRTYFNFTMPLARIPSHNLLAVLRAEKEGFVSSCIDADPEKCVNSIYSVFCHEHSYPSKALAEQIKMAIADAYKRLLDPSISNEIMKEAKQKADIESINVFGENLKQLLLSSPVGQKRTLAIDPGFRNGCKTVCLDEQGNLLHYEIIFPHPPQNEKVKSITAVNSMVEKYGIQAVAIGNGTAGRETEEFMRKIQLPSGCKVWTVSEDGASVYSASEVARKEFPDEDVTVRGAVSIGRRLMDPLAELVKIDPKSLGIGQYQHDVDQNLLKEKLDNTVQMCVNSVGVNVNTASPYLLSYVAGIGPSLAENIVSYRAKEGRFRSRNELKKVPRLGSKAFEQCAGFLRIKDAENPLDGSAVHPECYHIVARMADDMGVTASDLVGNEEFCTRIDAQKYVEGDFGLPTINDILKELAKPGLDPREAASDFEFSDDVRDLEDLFPGMELPGIVTNVTNFGAFVDIGLHENGLVHASQMGVRGHADPSRIVKLHQKVRVSVLDVDLERKRISLRLIDK